MQPDAAPHALVIGAGTFALSAHASSARDPANGPSQAFSLQYGVESAVAASPLSWFGTPAPTNANATQTTFAGASPSSSHN